MRSAFSAITPSDHVIGERDLLGTTGKNIQISPEVEAAPEEPAVLGCGARRLQRGPAGGGRGDGGRQRQTGWRAAGRASLLSVSNTRYYFIFKYEHALLQ